MFADGTIGSANANSSVIGKNNKSSLKTDTTKQTNSLSNDGSPANQSESTIRDKLGETSGSPDMNWVTSNILANYKLYHEDGSITDFALGASHIVTDLFTAINLNIVYPLFDQSLSTMFDLTNITNGKRAQIQQVRKEVSQVNKQQKQVTTQIDNLQTTYNANDQIAKSQLLAFAKSYYTFSSQSDYDKRFSKMSSILALSKDQQNKLFNNGLDATDGSRIDNLGLTSQYQTAISYTSDLDNKTIEVLATVIIQTSGTGQKAINQTVLLHGWFNTNIQKLTVIKINQIQ